MISIDLSVATHVSAVTLKGCSTAAMLTERAVAEDDRCVWIRQSRKRFSGVEAHQLASHGFGEAAGMSETHLNVPAFAPAPGLPHAVGQ